MKRTLQKPSYGLKQTAASAILLASLTLVLAALSAAAPATSPATAPAPRDWQTNPAIVDIQTDSDVYAIGDIHGDYDKAAKLLAGAGLIKSVPASPKDAVWSGGKSILVCTGDFVDKFNQNLEVIELLRTLELSAPKTGGRVVVTLGNHEAEFLAAGTQAATKKPGEFVAQLLAKGISPADVAAGVDSTGIGKWLRARPIAAKVNDSFFCHAGNTFGATLKELQQQIESGVDKDGFGASILSEPNSILEARMSPVPWFFRAPATAPADPNAQVVGPANLKKNLFALGCARLVIGHQPGKISFGGGIERNAGEPFSYEGLLFLMDVGMSRGVQDSRGIVLKIQHGAKDAVSAVDESGREVPIWPAK